MGIATPAGAAVVKASFRVGVTVVATCRIIPGQATGCAPSGKNAAAGIPLSQPVVTYSRDAKSGTTIETVEF